jgi:hypothetical protein
LEQVKVSRSLVFEGAANTKDNVVGNPSFKKTVVTDDFTGVTLDATNDYTVTVGGLNDAVAIDNSASGAAGGWISILSGDTDNEACFMATPLIFDISKNPVIEARLYLTKVTETALFFGFSDAVLEATPAMPIDDDGASPVAAADDVAGFVIDADSTTPSEIQCGYATAAGAATMIDSGIAAADGTTSTNILVLRVTIDSSGYVSYFVNGKLVGISTSAAVSDVPLCGMLATATRANGAGDKVFVDYIKYWQDR